MTASVVTAGIGTPAILFNDANELSTVLWMIGVFLGVIVLLLGAVCWFVRDMRNSNKAQHTLLFSGHNELSASFSHLQGEHAAAFNAQGCAYDSERLQNMITDSIIVAMNETGSGSFSECPHFKGNGAANG